MEIVDTDKEGRIERARVLKWLMIRMEVDEKDEDMEVEDRDKIERLVKVKKRQEKYLKWI